MLTLYRSERLPAAKEVGYNASKERILWGVTGLAGISEF
jgi:hypothetical protein